MSRKEVKGKGVECGRKVIQGIERALVIKGIPYLANPSAYRLDVVVSGIAMANLTSVEVNTASGVLEVEQKVFHHQRGQRTTSYRTEEVQRAFRFNVGIGATVFHRQDHVVFVELESIITNWDDAEEVNAVCELVVETIASGLMISPV